MRRADACSQPMLRRKYGVSLFCDRGSAGRSPLLDVKARGQVQDGRAPDVWRRRVPPPHQAVLQHGMTRGLKSTESLLASWCMQAAVGTSKPL